MLRAVAWDKSVWRACFKARILRRAHRSGAISTTQSICSRGRKANSAIPTIRAMAIVVVGKVAVVVLAVAQEARTVRVGRPARAASSAMIVRLDGMATAERRAAKCLAVGQAGCSPALRTIVGQATPTGEARVGIVVIVGHRAAHVRTIAGLVHPWVIGPPAVHAPTGLGHGRGQAVARMGESTGQQAIDQQVIGGPMQMRQVLAQVAAAARTAAIVVLVGPRPTTMYAGATIGTSPVVVAVAGMSQPRQRRPILSQRLRSRRCRWLSTRLPWLRLHPLSKPKQVRQETLRTPAPSERLSGRDAPALVWAL
jgi:hypothetical protein